MIPYLRTFLGTIGTTQKGILRCDAEEFVVEDEVIQQRFELFPDIVIYQ